MKYSICGFQTKTLMKYNLDSNDIVLLRWFVDFKDTGGMKHIVKDDEVYYWVLYKKVLEDNPWVKIKNHESLARRFNKYVEIGLLKKHVVKKGGTYTYFNLVGEVYKEFIEHPTLKSGKSKGDTGEGEKHPTPKSSEAKTPDSKVDPHPTIESGDTRLKSRYKDNLISDNSINRYKDKVKSDSINPEIRSLTQLFYDEIKANSNPPTWNTRPPSLNTWYKDLEKLNRLDGVSVPDIKRVIMWATRDSFWKSNILSGKKLREKFDRLFLQMGRTGSKKQQTIAADIDKFLGEDHGSNPSGFSFM